MVRHEHFQITCASLVAANLAVEQLCTTTPGIPKECKVRVPSGHAGLTGFQLAYAHQQIIPWTAGAFVIGDGEVFEYDLEGYGDSGAWSMWLYNTDVIPHTWSASFAIASYARPPKPRRVTPISRADIHAAAVTFIRT